MSTPSCTKLSKALIATGFVRYTKKYLAESCEAYGRKVMCYFTPLRHDVPAILEAIESVGGKPNFDWCPYNPSAFSVRVSYFKAWHWDE